MTTIADIQKKIIEKLENKFKSAQHANKLLLAFGDQDRDKDGLLSLAEFQEALKFVGNALSDDESGFLFHFWDTVAGQQEPQGFIDYQMAVQDLMNTQPTYGTAFRSGEEQIKTNKGAKGNQPSQQGGIFSGGSYEADARGECGSGRGAPMAPMGAARAPMPPMAAPQRPKNNQSSIEGGIFGAAPTAYEPPPSAGGRDGNKSNQSSIAGGIFGEGPAEPMKAKQGRNSNQSSIPGGIFG